MKIRTIIAAGIAAIALAGCTTDADVASRNISKDADNFNIVRRIVFVNGITDNYFLVVEGRCSIFADVPDDQLEVTCKTEDGYVKHYLGLADNVTYIAEQIEGADVSVDHYKVVFKPSTIVPDIEVR